MNNLYGCAMSQFFEQGMRGGVSYINKKIQESI